MEVLLTQPDDLDRAAELVRAHLGATADVTLAREEQVVRFRTAKGEDDLARLLSALVAAGVGVTQFREVQTDLEEAFMTVARADEEERMKAERKT